MQVHIYKLVTDNVGNQGWEYTNTQTLALNAVLAYITNLALDGNSYAAEIGDDAYATRIAQVP